MNFKKSVVTFILVTIFQPSYSRGNSRFYVNLGAEYAVQVMGRRGFEGENFYNFLPPSAGGQMYLSRNINQKVSFGDGLWVNGNIGYYLTQNLAFDLGIQMGISQNKKVATNTFEEGGLGDFYKAISYTKYPLLLSPGIKYRYLINQDFSIHAKIGVALPVLSKVYVDEWWYPNNLSSSEIETKFSLGFTSAIGAEYQILKNLTISAEVALTALNMDTKVRTMQSFTRNGQDIMDQIPEWQKTTFYEDDFRITPGSSQTPKGVIKAPFEIPFSRLGFTVGVCYTF